jgi:hypothetical protein
LQSGSYNDNAKVHEINAESITATNSITEENIAIETENIEVENNQISYVFPAHSITQFEIEIEK